jgi:hypothetical protein
MHFGKYKKARPREFVESLNKSLREPLTPMQKEQIKEYVEYSHPYTVVEDIKKAKSTLLWRMSGIFFLLYVLLFYIFSPLKWVLTGTAVYDRDGIIVRIYKNWLKHLPY